MKKIIGIILTAVICLWLAELLLVKPMLESIATKVIGAPVTLGSFSFNPLAGRISISNFRIFNEQGFKPGTFFNAAQIIVDINSLQALKGKFYCPLVVFRVDKMIIYKNKAGKLNVNELPIVQQKLHEKNKGPAPNFKIDQLHLDIAQVIVEDDSQDPPMIEAYNLNLKNKTIRQVDSVPKLIGAVLFEALKPTALQGAGMYLATSLAGVGFLPGLALGLIMANDDAVADLAHSPDEIYQKSLSLVNKLGKLKRQDKNAGQIFAKVYNCDISIQITRQGFNTAHIVIKARKYFLAKPEIAAGLIYQLKED